jgi:hypothetical protein
MGKVLVEPFLIIFPFFDQINNVQQGHTSHVAIGCNYVDLLTGGQGFAMELPPWEPNAESHTASRGRRSDHSLGN